MMMKTMRHGALALLATLLVSCGGIDSPNDSDNTTSAPALLSLSGAGTASAGAGAVPLTAAHTGSGTVAWQLAAGNPGTLSATSGDSVNYLPPPAGAVTSPTTVTVTATVDGVSKSAAITLNPAAPGVYLAAGTINGFGNVDGTGSGARFSIWNYPSLAVDANGNAFTTDAASKTVRKITPQGVVTTYAGRFGTTASADGPVASATFELPATVAVDRNDNLYVGDGSLVRKITPAGVVSTVANFGATASILGLAVAADGTLYAGSYNVIYKVSPTGAVTTLAGAGSGSFVDSPNGFGRLGGMALDASGNLIVADQSRYVIWQVTPNGTVTTLAGSEGNRGTVDGAASSARFAYPSGIAIDAAGRIFVTDMQNHTVRVITRAGSGATVATFAGHNNAPNADLGFWSGISLDGSAGTATFAMPTGIAINPSGELLVGDGSAIRKVSTSGAVSTVAGVLVNFRAVDGTGSSAAFDLAYYGGALWSDAGGTLYLADIGSSTVRRITPAGTVTTIAGGLYAPGSADGASLAARFSNPRGIVGDANGNLYVADSGNATIRKIAADGTVSTLAGSAGARGTADGTGSAARFYSLDGMVLDAAGNLFVIDNQFGSESQRVVIRKVTPSGVVTTFVRSQADYAEALAIDASGNLYLAAYTQAVVYKIAPNGTETVLAGAANDYGTADGTGSAARFTGIGGVTIDPAGNVYAMETNGGTIRKITPAGVVTTVAGTSGRIGPLSASAALPGLLPDAWAIRWVGSNTLAVMGDNGIFKVVLP